MNEKQPTKFEKGMGKLLATAITVGLFSGAMWLSYMAFTFVLK